MIANVLILALTFASCLKGTSFWAMAIGDYLIGPAQIIAALAVGAWLGSRSKIGLPSHFAFVLPILGYWVLKGAVSLGVSHPIWLLIWVATLGATGVSATARPKLSPSVVALFIGAIVSAVTAPFYLWFSAAGAAMAATSARRNPKGIAALALTLALIVAQAEGHRRLTDSVVSEQGRYTRWVEKGQSKDNWTRNSLVFGNGQAHFSSENEPGSHQCLARVPLEWLGFSQKPASRIAIVGPELGMLTRELVENPNVEKVTLVPGDLGSIRLATKSTGLRTYNRDALTNKKVTIESMQPFAWAMANQKTYDAILVALPTPRTRREARLFSAEFYRALSRNADVISIWTGTAPDGMDLDPWTAAIKQTFQKLHFQSHVFADTRSRRTYLLVPAKNAEDPRPFFEDQQMLTTSATPQVCQHNRLWRSPATSSLALNRLPRPRPTYSPGSFGLLPQ